MLLLDEPVSGLDPIVTAELYGVIEELNRSGLTVVMISHDISAAVNYATHILHLGSTPLFFGTKEDYLESEVGQMLQAPTVCTCIPLIKPLITPTKNSEKFISIAPVTPHSLQNVQNPQSASRRARPGTRVQKNTVPRIAKTTIGQQNAVSNETEAEENA
jgi:ABC-type multidrug transport system ATPase subunit